MPAIAVEFLDESYLVEDDDVFRFGRDGDLVLDDANRFMHRTVGTIARAGSVWVIQNLGRPTELPITTSSGKRSELPSGGTEALLDDTIDVQFQSGPSTYGFRIRMVEPPELPEPPAQSAQQTATSDFGVVALNEEQRKMLAAFAEPRQREGAGTRTPVPANAAVAARLGWAAKKLDRKLDYLCRRLTERGVRGLRGQIGDEAVDRRQRLVDHVVLAGLVSSVDLRLLDP